jgi:DNA mismatch repair protein MutS
LKDSKIWQHFRILLGNIRDIEKIRRKLIMGKISPRDFFYLYDNLSIIKNLNHEIKNDKNNAAVFNYINNFVYDTTQKSVDTKTDKSCQIMLGFVEKYFNLELAKTIDDITPEKLSNLNMDQMHFINKGISKEYDEKIRACIDSREQLECIREFFSKLIKTYEKTAKTNDFIKIHETAKMDAILIGTNRRVNILQGEINKLIKQKNGETITLPYISKYTNSEESITLNLISIEYLTHGGNKSNLQVTSPEIKVITNNIQTSKDTLIAIIISFYNKILLDFVPIQDEYLNNIILYITQVDLLQCKAYIATKYNYFKPYIETTAEKSFVEIEQIRHCLIEQINDKELYVSNDLTLGRGINGVLLYGTNAVGKTSLIKSIGIALIMAQAGLYVPASKFNYYPYNYLFTRILGNDNIFKGLSTFAVEMSELRTILKLANQNSMILGDELCSGTESTSALSIFVSGLERLYKLDSTFIFATHFHEVVNYDEIRELDRLKMCHMSVIYNKQERKLIYDRKLKDGPGESMYGLEVCKSMDLPDDFLERAHELRTKYINKETNILSIEGSHFNVKKLKGVCELCNSNWGEEVHHLQHQNRAINNYINDEFHKNHLANLLNVCCNCHDKLHKLGEQHKIVKTSNGYEILPL